METKKSHWVWIVFFLVLILASPLIEGGETYQTVIWLRLWVIGFGLFFFLGTIKQDRIELVLPRANRIIGLLWLLFTLSLFITHYYYITVYWYTNFLVYFLLGYLCLGIFAAGGREKLPAAVFIILVASGTIESVYGIIAYFRPHYGQISGTFFNPAYYAGYLSALISFPLAGAVFQVFPGLSRQKEILVRSGLALLAVLYFIAMVLCASRAIIFAGIPVGLILLARFRWKALAVLAAIALAIVLIPNPLKERVKMFSRDPYRWERVTIWKSSLRMIEHHPAGVGLGMYQYYYSRYAYPVQTVKIGRFGKEARFAHDDYLNLAAEASPAAPALGLLWLAIILSPLPAALFRRGERGSEWALLIAFSASLFAMLSHALVDDNLRQPPIAIIAVVDVAAVLALISGWKPGSLREKSYPLLRAGFLRGFLAVSGVILAVIVTYQAAIFGLSFRAGKIRDPEQRVSYLARLSRLPSGYANLYFQLAIDCKHLFETQKNSRYGSDAAHYFQSAADLNPENAQYFYRWAEFLYRSGLNMNNDNLLSEAEKVGKESLARSDKLPFTYLMLANIAHLKKDFAQEEKWLKIVLDLEPYFFLGRLSLVDLYIEEGKFGEAKSQFEILQGQKQEVDQILKKETVEVRTLNDSQLLLVRISPEDMQRVQKELETH